MQSDCSVLFITKTHTGCIKFYDMEPNILIYALNEFIVIYCKIILIIDTIFIIINIFSIIKYQGLVARHKYSLFSSVLLGYIWLPGTFVNSSCDIKIIIKIVKIAV